MGEVQPYVSPARSVMSTQPARATDSAAAHIASRTCVPTVGSVAATVGMRDHADRQVDVEDPPPRQCVVKNPPSSGPGMLPSRRLLRALLGGGRARRARPRRRSPPGTSLCGLRRRAPAQSETG
jgi:hypothetical protein